VIGRPARHHGTDNAPSKGSDPASFEGLQMRRRPSSRPTYSRLPQNYFSIWIQWLPAPVFGTWAPHHLRRVCRGAISLGRYCVSATYAGVIGRTEVSRTNSRSCAM
jgi:hypothetical protein